MDWNYNTVRAADWGLPMSLVEKRRTQARGLQAKKQALNN